ncbi:MULTISPECIES: manganese-dependent inorganic pyrophosphatase [Ferrimonas]|uniref:manganese-dependent inorganic pyrophosphatase n=1 Tax=Ferrimonas TaxID=44011 RepID=UPI0004161D38|nr:MULTISPECIES: manganese-dependent inorganic pyrophosphatase [Ferrimonas]USD38930.1 manganese-dependent inorganic pyrophosphatase [Ferrimonas sp. SCSIO 43195]
MTTRTLSLAALSLVTAIAWPAFSADLDLTLNDHPIDQNTLWFGHINPDTDTIVSAMMAAKIYGGQARSTGKLNKETQYVLDTLKLDTPPLATNLAAANVALVDFNQTTQLMPGVNQNNIQAVIDHHALRDNPIALSSPISINIKPWGSAATIIADDAERHGIALSKSDAGLLLAGILSDTLNLSSATTTERDRQLVASLSATAGLDADEFAANMFKAKSDLSDVSAYDIVVGDYKNYSINGKNVGFGVAEVLSSDELLGRVEELRQALGKARTSQKRDHIFFAIVDMQKKTAYVITENRADEKLANKAYGVKMDKRGLFVLSDTLSRKRQMMPAIKGALSK